MKYSNFSIDSRYCPQGRVLLLIQLENTIHGVCMCQKFHGKKFPFFILKVRNPAIKCVGVDIGVCMCVYIYMYVCVFVCVCVCVCVCGLEAHMHMQVADESKCPNWE